MEEPTVFVVDDDEQIRDSLRTLVEAMGLPVRVFASANAFRDFYRDAAPGCLILDIRMPGKNGLELYQELLSEGKRLPVIFITGHADVTTAVAAMKTGAIEFLEKPFDHRTLRTMIDNALDIDRQWRQRETEYQQFEESIRKLTSRERETLHLILSGRSNKQMAAQLFISERAVEMRRASIMKKLKATSLAELLDRAITHRVLNELRQASHEHQVRAQ